MDRLPERITFHPEIETMEADFSDLLLNDPASVEFFYDAVEECIRQSGRDKWFFLVNYRNCRIMPEAWLAHSLRGKRLNLTHSLGTVRFDASPETRAEIARRAGFPRTPSLYLVPSRVLNAFAVGTRDNAAIAVTDGMLRSLSLRELAGVLAHEISHIRNRDLWVMNLADTISRLTAVMSFLGMMMLIFLLPLILLGLVSFPVLLPVVLIFAPTVGNLLQLALSRTREYDADADAAELTGDPRGLASALAKMERLQGRLWETILFPGQRIPDPSLLRTHPPTQERIDRLLSIHPAAPPIDLPADGSGRGPSGHAAVTGAPRRRWTGSWY